MDGWNLGNGSCGRGQEVPKCYKPCVGEEEGGESPLEGPPLVFSPLLK